MAPRFLVSSNTSFSIIFYLECQNSVAVNVVYIIYTFTNILLLLPIYILILYMGFHRWRRQRTAPAGVTMSHSDFFTYNMMILEIIVVFGSVVFTLSIPTNSYLILMLGVHFFCITFPGQTFFHVLTCVERYLAVVHPITYMRLRETHGVRIRNTSTVCVWLLCAGWVGVTNFYLPKFPVVPYLSLGVGLVIIVLCCLSVLHALARPGPGEVGGNKERVGQSKQRAFHLIIAIMGALMLRFFGILAGFVIEINSLIDSEDMCLLMDVVLWLSVPSSLVLPLLFLHGAGKLSCCVKKTESG